VSLKINPTVLWQKMPGMQKIQFIRQDDLNNKRLLGLAGNRNTDGSFANLSTNANFWSSTVSGSNAWNRNLNSTNATVNRNENDQANGFSVRCLKDWSVSRNIFPSIIKNGGNSEIIKKIMNEKLLEDLFQAYFDARKNKRKTFSALKFEERFEENIFKLYEEIVSGRYQPGRSICFVVDRPIKREIFAADFRDRIVHHFIYNYINPIFEKHFIYDSYSCRNGKGVRCGIRRVDHFIRSCSQNYKKDCYILKLDISGYFMSINKDILYNQVKKRLLLQKEKTGLDFDFNLVLGLLQKTIYSDPTKNCKIKGKSSDWDNLPKSKSLFHCEKNSGLPIGNLTSQLFGNVYLNDLDYFVSYVLKCKYYGRYVDDFVIIHQSKDFLKKIILSIREYILKNLLLKLHPRKIYLQHFSKGVDFLGVYLKPFRIYIKNKNKGNARKKIAVWNEHLLRKNNVLNREEAESFLSFINSILGMMKHYNSYNLRKKILTKEFSILFYNYFYIDFKYCRMFKRENKIFAFNFIEKAVE